MASDAVGDEADAVGDFLRGLDAGVLDFAAGAHHPTALGEAELGVDLGQVLAHHELDAELHVPFFTGLGEEDDVAVEGDLAALEQQHRHERGRDVVFIIDGAAAVDVAALAGRGERAVFPLLRIDVHGIGVRHDEQWAFRAVAPEAGDEVWALRIEGEDLGFDALGFENAFEIFDGGDLVTGRITGVHAHERLKVSHRFLVNSGEVDGWGGLRGGGDGEDVSEGEE